MAMLRKVGLRIAYDGTGYYGFQSQPGKRTIEGDVIAILKKIGAISETRNGRYRSSSRTDRGVSAIGNVVSVVTEMSPQKIARAINAMAGGVWCTGTVILPDEFDVRRARSRTYACYVCDQGQKLPAMRKASKAFIGEHDFSHYSKSDGRSPVRKIRRIRIARHGRLIEFVIVGESFLWNQVRRMVWALDQVGQGNASAAQISPEHFSLSRIGIAPAENLVLLSVDIGAEFEIVDPGPHTVEQIRKHIASATVRAALYENLLEVVECK